MVETEIKEAEHDRNSIMRFGRNLVIALEQRINFEKTAVDMYNTDIARMEAIGDSRKSDKLLKIRARKNIEETALDYYKSVRRKLYDETDKMLGDKSEMYKLIFKSVFLEGRTAQEIAKATNYSENDVSLLIIQMQDMVFDYSTGSNIV